MTSTLPSDKPPEELKYGESVTKSKIGAPHSNEASYCGGHPITSGGLFYTLSNISGAVTL